jgi:PleD family two-component response regulator
VVADEATKPGGAGKAIILVVERDPNVRELESHFLQQAGFSVDFEQDGPGALAQARKLLPDIVIGVPSATDPQAHRGEPRADLRGVAR